MACHPPALARDARDLLALRDRIDELEEQVRQFNAALAPKVGFPKGWQLDARDSAILSALHACRGSYMTSEALLLAAVGFDENYTGSDVRAWIGRLRKKVEPHGIGIVTRNTEGYALTAESRPALSAALGERVVAPPAPDAVAARPIHPRGWTEAEDEIIRKGYARDATLLGIRLDLLAAGHRSRSPGGISVQAQKLGLTSDRCPARWTAAEDEIVTRSYAEEIPVAKIRLVLAEAGYRRNRSAIGMRIVALGISGDRKRLWTPSERDIVQAGLRDGLTYDDIRDRLRAAGYERGRTAVTKLVRTLGVRRGDRPWTPDEIERLRRLYAEKTPQREIAQALDRPVGGINSMASRLGIKQRFRWTEDERDRLRQGCAAGERMRSIAESIGRPYPNVATEARRMGLPQAPGAGA